MSTKYGVEGDGRSERADSRLLRDRGARAPTRGAEETASGRDYRGDGQSKAEMDSHRAGKCQVHDSVQTQSAARAGARPAEQGRPVPIRALHAGTGQGAAGPQVRARAIDSPLRHREARGARRQAALRRVLIDAQASEASNKAA